MPLDEMDQSYMMGPTTTTASAEPAQFASQTQIRALGGALIVFAVLLAYLFIVFWDKSVTANATDGPRQVCAAGDFLCFSASLDSRVLILVMLAGALGSFIHAATSFGDFVGNKQLTTNWIWWYILKPFIGSLLAAIFYLCIRGGFMSGSPQAGSINLYGITALSGLVGMFSKQATDKLGELFTTMFKTNPGGGDLKRKEGLDNAVPMLSGSTPARLAPGTRDLLLTITGKGFIEKAVVQVNGSLRSTIFKDSTHLSVTLLDTDVAREGQLSVTVVNPAPRGGTSAPLIIPVTSVSNIPERGAANDEKNQATGSDTGVTAEPVHK